MKSCTLHPSRIFLACLAIAAAANISLSQAVDRSKPPALGPPVSLKLPRIEHRTLSNGIPVHIMEKHDLPLVEMQLGLMAGSAFDPEDKPGIASLTADLLEEGAGARN